MGKYHADYTRYDIGGSVDLCKLNVLADICNELAEANRLRRIKIRMEFNSEQFTTDSLSEELHDRA